MTRALFGRLAESLQSDWRLKARPSQLPPVGEWTVWLILSLAAVGGRRGAALSGSGHG
jgi:phage terminase large subunit-like protein